MVVVWLKLKNISSTGGEAGRDAICPCTQWQFGQPGGHSLPWFSSGQSAQPSAPSSEQRIASTVSAAVPDSCTDSNRSRIRNALRVPSTPGAMESRGVAESLSSDLQAFTAWMALRQATDPGLRTLLVRHS